MLQDRRSEPRLKTQEAGKVFTSSSPVTSCCVIEQSERGARLLFAEEAPASDDLLLVMESVGEVRIGVVRWRLGRTVGIEYTRDPGDLLD